MFRVFRLKVDKNAKFLNCYNHFSRFNSTRLPGKALELINGREMLGWVIDRARLVDDDIPVIVATSSEEQDDQIAEFSSAMELSVLEET